MARRESVLTDHQKASLAINNFIFHIIDPDGSEDGVVYLDDVELGDGQRTFFLERLRETAVGTQYVFREDAVHLRNPCTELIADPSRLAEVSRQITEDFAGRHKGNMAQGVFVVAVASLQDGEARRSLIFLVKLDHKASITYETAEKAGRRLAVVKEIPNSLIESKSAVQKSALIDLSSESEWDVLAFDRNAPALTDYFRGFLGVSERQDPSYWTRAAHNTVKRWARTIPDADFPVGENVASYAGRALSYLRNHSQFDTDSFLEMVVRDENSDRKQIMIANLRAELAASGVAGQQFTCRPNSISDKGRRTVYETAEGVSVAFEGDPSALGIKMENVDGNRRVITIETSNVKIRVAD